MGYNFLPYDQDQLYLLPPSIREWVGEGSLARFVSDVVEELDAESRLGEFYAGYPACGGAGAGPAIIRACWSRCCCTATAAG